MERIFYLEVLLILNFFGKAPRLIEFFSNYIIQNLFKTFFSLTTSSWASAIAFLKIKYIKGKILLINATFRLKI